MRRGPEAPQCAVGEMTSVTTERIALIVAACGMRAVVRQRVFSRPIFGDSTICTATYMKWYRIVGIVITKERRTMVVLE